MSRYTSDEKLDEMGIPNNLLARAAYRVTYRAFYATAYTGLVVASVVTRKDKLTILNNTSVKLGLGPVDPTP